VAGAVRADGAASVVMAGPRVECPRGRLRPVIHVFPDIAEESRSRLLAIASSAGLLVSGDEDLTDLVTAYSVASPAMPHRLLAGS